MKPTREPVSSRPKPSASLKKPHECCLFTAPCGPRRKKMTVVRHQLSLRNLPVDAFDSRAQGFNKSRGSSTIELPSAFSESGAYPLDRVLPEALRDTQCFLPLACRHPPEVHLIGARKGRTPGNTILSQPYHRRVSTDKRITKAASWLHLSRVSPVLHPLERPSHTHTPKPGFGGRGHEVMEND